MRPELSTLAYWIDQQGSHIDDPLLDLAELSSHDTSLRFAKDGRPRFMDLERQVPAEELHHELSARFEYLRTRLESNSYVSEERGALASVSDEALNGFRPERTLRVALDTVRLHCAPFAAPIQATKPPSRFDRNQCSSVRAQQPVELLGRLPNGFLVARSRLAFGFVAPQARLSPPVSEELGVAYRTFPRLTLTQSLKMDGMALDNGTLLARVAPEGVLVASDSGIRQHTLEASQVRSTQRVLTRRALLTEAFRYLGTPYGWGDEGGGRDCSRLVLDVLDTFGLRLPRTSDEQSQAGSYTIEVPAAASRTERLSLLDEAAKRGLVLVHLSGHIMIYLGRDGLGEPRVLHSLAEYLAPCADGGETLFEVNRIRVTGLELGAGTSRGSFLERIVHLTVFGKAPGYELLALTEFRQAAAPPELNPKLCSDSADVSLFRSPREPHTAAPLRVIASTTEDTRPARLWLIDPTGTLLSPQMHELGVGPFTRWTEVSNPQAGRWTALVADGDRVLACERFRVASRSRTSKGAMPARAPDAPAWNSQWRWERDTEHLYAGFVEQLFSYPLDDTRTFSDLQELLSNPERNLLYDHLGLAEDARLGLKPDCADLPYMLRAYFAWKVGLPFGFRHCSRGKPAVPPRCGELLTNELTTTQTDDVSAFKELAQRTLASAVHSASGRTVPDDAQTDLYPVALTRRALSPGTVFVDPYGHLIVVAKWVPQGIAGVGMLLGADAQPDASVGRRRFWQGNFLFTPDTSEVGAGFKAFRPLAIDSKSQHMQTLDNDKLSNTQEFASYSAEQYALSKEGFYTRMDELIYPRAVAVGDSLRRLVDALEEQTLRRISAIDIGEAFMRDSRAVVDMPEGHDIFETQGPWEDFATPARDMRLLIAIDTVRAFPDRVRSQPERYGIARDDVADSVAALTASLRRMLEERRFEYTRSDDTKQSLRLSDVVDRAQALEIAYNPNDCVETRWAAPEGSTESASCKRAAPEAQRNRMAQYRDWFRARERPPR